MGTAVDFIYYYLEIEKYYQTDSKTSFGKEGTDGKLVEKELFANSQVNITFFTEWY